MTKKLIIIFSLLFLARMALAWEPALMNSYFRKGERLFSEGKYEQAIEAFEKFLELYPNNMIVQDYIKKAKEGLRKETNLLNKETIQLMRDRKYQEAQDRRLLPKINREEILRRKREARLEEIKAREESRVIQKQRALAKKEAERKIKEERFLAAQQAKERRATELAFQNQLKKKLRQGARFKAETEKRHTTEMAQKNKGRRATEAALQSRDKAKEHLNQKFKSRAEKIQIITMAEQDRARQTTEKAIIARTEAKERLDQKIKSKTERALKSQLSQRKKPDTGTQMQQDKARRATISALKARSKMKENLDKKFKVKTEKKLKLKFSQAKKKETKAQKQIKTSPDVKPEIEKEKKPLPPFRLKLKLGP